WATGPEEDMRNRPLPPTWVLCSVPKLWPVVTPRSSVLPLFISRPPAAWLFAVMVIVWLCVLPSPMYTWSPTVGAEVASGPVWLTLDQGVVPGLVSDQSPLRLL